MQLFVDLNEGPETGWHLGPGVSFWERWRRAAEGGERGENGCGRGGGGRGQGTGGRDLAERHLVVQALGIGASFHL
jgi:hypothetical protein